MNLFKRYVEMTDDIRYAMGTANIGITGGEPMLREDILEIIRFIPEGMEGQLYTTGYRIDDEFAAKLINTNLTRCIISLDHFEEEIVCRLRNSKRAFQDAVRACKSLAGAGIYTAVTVCITEELLLEGALKRYVEFAKELEVSEVRIVMQIPQGKLMGKNVGRIYGQSINFIKQIQEVYKEDESYPTFVNFSDLESSRYFGCGAGANYITINNDGLVTPCVAVPLSFGSVYKEQLPDIYKKMERYFPTSNIVCYGVASGSVIKRENIAIKIPPLSVEQSIIVAKKCNMVTRKSAIFKACENMDLNKVKNVQV